MSHDVGKLRCRIEKVPLYTTGAHSCFITAYYWCTFVFHHCILLVHIRVSSFITVYYWCTFVFLHCILLVHICVSSLYTSGAHSCFIIHHCILLLHIRVYYLYSFTYTDVQHVLSITWYTCRLTVAQRVPLVEQELFTPSLRSILILYK
jgi:hypothetical protein